MRARYLRLYSVASWENQQGKRRFDATRMDLQLIEQNLDVGLLTPIGAIKIRVSKKSLPNLHITQCQKQSLRLLATPYRPTRLPVYIKTDLWTRRRKNRPTSP